MEKFAQNIRDVAAKIEAAEVALHTLEADLKRLIAVRKIEAAGRGINTASHQETYVDSLDDIYAARLGVATARGLLSGLRVEQRAREVEFETWRTEQANTRREAARYGA
jgi:hypothetical protein